MGRTFTLATVEQVREVIRNNEKPEKDLLCEIPEFQYREYTAAILIRWNNTAEDYEGQVVLVNAKKTECRSYPQPVTEAGYEVFASEVRGLLGVGPVTGLITYEQVQRQTPLHLLLMPQEVERPVLGSVTLQFYALCAKHN